MAARARDARTQTTSSTDSSADMTENPLSTSTQDCSAPSILAADADVETALAEFAEVSPQSAGAIRKLTEALATQQHVAAAALSAFSQSTPTNWHQVIATYACSRIPTRDMSVSR